MFSIPKVYYFNIKQRFETNLTDLELNMNYITLITEIMKLLWIFKNKIKLKMFKN